MAERYVTNLYTRFAALAKAAPAAAALRYADGTVVSRGELAALAGRQADRLAFDGVRRGDVVGLFHDKQPAAYALMLACLKLGAAYVNLDERNPPQRLARILDTCRPRLIFGPDQIAADAAAACATWGIPTGSLAEASVMAAPETPKSGAVIGSDIAYIMFTSGSTGTPKGVAISHAQVSNLIDWAAEEFTIEPDDTLTNVNPMFFDNSVFDFYASLFNGAALAPFSQALLQDPLALVAAVAQARCTLWFSVPSLLIFLTATKVLGAQSWPALRTLAFGGEGYPIPELRKLHSLFGDRIRLVNVYGPTECTCICSAYEVAAADLVEDHGLPPIGRLAKNFRGLLLDGKREVGGGETGELCLIGPNVGLGYYRDPERTAEAFAANPLCPTHAERMYRTGDLMRIDPADGLLRFVGRKDHQFKHMGYRIEPGEIEAAINRLDGVRRAVVVYKRQRQAFGEIVGFVAASGSWDEDGIKEALRQALPAYMVPTRIEIRESLPLNANGKVDRNRLFEEA